MRKNLNLEARSLIDHFVQNLGVKERGIALRYIPLSNGSNPQLELARLQIQYGDKLRKVSDQIEALRRKIDCEYGILQRGLQEELEQRIHQ